jgi:hypothetical protein
MMKVGCQPRLRNLAEVGLRGTRRKFSMRLSLEQKDFRAAAA